MFSAELFVSLFRGLIVFIIFFTVYAFFVTGTAVPFWCNLLEPFTWRIENAVRVVMDCWEDSDPFPGVTVAPTDEGESEEWETIDRQDREVGEGLIPTLVYYRRDIIYE